MSIQKPQMAPGPHLSPLTAANTARFNETMNGLQKRYDSFSQGLSRLEQLVSASSDIDLAPDDDLSRLIMMCEWVYGRAPIATWVKGMWTRDERNPTGIMLWQNTMYETLFGEYIGGRDEEYWNDQDFVSADKRVYETGDPEIIPEDGYNSSASRWERWMVAKWAVPLQVNGKDENAVFGQVLATWPIGPDQLNNDNA